MSVPKSLCSPATNLYTLVVDFVKFRRLVKEALHLHLKDCEKISISIILAIIVILNDTQIPCYHPPEVTREGSIEGWEYFC